MNRSADARTRFHTVDYVAFFQTPDGNTTTIGVVVKPTEQPVRGRFPFPSALLKKFSRSRTPTLLLVIDVKRSAASFAWAHDAVPADQHARLDTAKAIPVGVREGTADEIAKLRAEILAL